MKKKAKISDMYDDDIQNNATEMEDFDLKVTNKYQQMQIYGFCTITCILILL